MQRSALRHHAGSPPDARTLVFRPAEGTIRGPGVPFAFVYTPASAPASQAGM